ncbi:hypothetical protein SAMN04487764_1429 [Gillisia sp. Hel1_33_143]|uniref:hypothetical protein n=1 Tax=Gillisia sp. Hel1_33_143 TaxID=1336796 RepID=UPI00087CEDE2|nr:hypothetical protein [Gillisia sp. Hel1_33_143]SDS09090.1 hypothetical protein SAMN04487764_1429 [Gillisia sp. Hel1_33_143]
MKLYTSISKKILFFIAPVTLFLFTSCGSYHYSGYENDSVYGDSSRTYGETEQMENQESNKNYYQNLFEEEAALYGDVLAEGAVFTDVENYSSSDGDYEGDIEYNYQGGNAAWGTNPDSYSINIINNGFYGNGYYGGFYNPYWAGGIFDPWGPGYYGPGNWGFPYGFGYGGFYGNRYGYGYAVHPFLYGAGGWYNPYNFYGNRYTYYNQNNIAYNTGRRNSTSTYRSNRSSDLRNATSLGNRGRNSSYSRSIRNIRNSNDDYGISRRSSNSYNTRSGSYDGYSRSNRSSTNSPVYRSTRSSNSSSTRSSSSTTRRSSGTVRSNSGSSRSSGTTRSSGGSSRSSSRGRNN